MFKKVLTTTVLSIVTLTSLNAKDFNAQAEEDRKAMIKYFEKKFENPEKNRYEYFPYSTDEELAKQIDKGLKHQDFGKGNYAYNIDGRITYEQMKEFPPYEEDIEKGEELWNKPFKNGKAIKDCFKAPTDYAKYPYFDEAKNEVVTISETINKCITSNGGKKLNDKKGDMARIQAYMANETKEAGLKVNVKIESVNAAAAYERGKEYFYTQRGYLKLNCAECHVQGAGKRVRNEKLSQTLGHVTHFPVYRMKWQGLGTLERRMSGCIKDQGQVPPKTTSPEMKELLFYMSYISNGMKFDGPDIRK